MYPSFNTEVLDNLTASCNSAESNILYLLSKSFNDKVISNDSTNILSNKWHSSNTTVPLGKNVFGLSVAFKKYLYDVKNISDFNPLFLAL